MIAYLKQLSYRQLLLFSALLSLLFSFFEILPGAPINLDGVWYIHVAKIYWQSGWSAAMALYPWPFLPIFAAWISHFSGLSLLLTFHLINFLCQALIIISFIKLTKILGGNMACQRWAALVILIFPYLNSTRAYITRDFGYWGFGLLAVTFLIQYLQGSRWRHALLWGLCILIAALFRVEGLLIFAAAPLALWLQPTWPWKKKFLNYLIANGFLILVGIFFLSWHHLHPQAAHASRLMEFRDQLLHIIPQTFYHLQSDALKIQVAVLNELSKDNAFPMLIGGLGAVFIFSIVSAFKPLYLLLACYGQAKKLIHNSSGEVFLLAWLIIFNAIMVAIFVIEKYFSAPRYPVFLILLWMAWVPFSLAYLDEAWKNKRFSHWFWWLIILILIFMAIGGLVRFGYSKTYLTQSGAWLQQNMPLQTKFYTNSRIVNFYAGREDDDSLESGVLKNPCHYDWIALRVNQHESLPRAIQAFVTAQTPTKIFKNSRHDQVLIYQTKEFC